MSCSKACDHEKEGKDMLATQKLIGNSEDNRRQEKHCNCKRSNCLKLYCECFASGVYCHKHCNCVNCFNNQTTEYLRRNAVETTLDRNPNAFRPKIVHENKNVLVAESSKAGPARHHKGCHCKKSWCLKKYCECFQANTYCTSKCKCHDCKNFEGSVFRDKIAPRPPSSAQVKEEDSGQQDSDVDSLEREIMEVEMRNQLGGDFPAELSNDGADTPASSSTTEDRKRPAPSEATRLAVFLTEEKLVSISSGLVRAAQQLSAQQHQNDAHSSRPMTPVTQSDSETSNSHQAKRACTANDRQGSVHSGEQSPAVDDLLACAEQVDTTPEPSAGQADAFSTSTEVHRSLRDEVILQTFSDALRELAYAILPSGSS